MWGEEEEERQLKNRPVLKTLKKTKQFFGKARMPPQPQGGASGTIFFCFLLALGCARCTSSVVEHVQRLMP
jgi:hypothetical protein